MKAPRKHPPVRTVVVAILLAGLSTASAAVIDTAVNPANGHTYYLLDNNNWTGSESAAVALGGHLVTINDAAENVWVWDRWGTNRNLWIGLSSSNGAGAETFQWVSGSSSVYRNWRGGEPNGDRYTYILAKESQLGAVWNDVADLPSDGGLIYGVVEIEVCTPHGAAATAILFGQFVVSATLTDSGCGYSNAPSVTIQGGGGSGATAVASISKGMVTNVTILSAGSGYTSAPQILFSSPPFEPSLGISVSKVRVTQHLMLGTNYILQSSSNMMDWVPAGSPFTATNEMMTAEFDLDSEHRFFRIQQLP